MHLSQIVKSRSKYCSNLKSIIFNYNLLMLHVITYFQLLFDVLNIELAALLEWFNANRLTLNFGKTFYMLFHRKSIKSNNLKLTIGQGTLKQTSQCKYLGLITLI